MSRFLRLAGPAALLVAFATTESDAQRSTGSRASELAQWFNKSKNVSKTVRGVKREKFREVIARPMSLNSPKDYSGSYADDDFGLGLDLAIDSSGRGAGWGVEPRLGTTARRSFTLENVRVDSALLTATKKYENGATEPFEAVFLTRSDRSHPDSAATVRTGLGVKSRHYLELAPGLQTDRYFLVRQD